ncbi:MAG: ABC transporter substrate-binding protein [Promethearchaeota archaeon]
MAKSNYILIIGIAASLGIASFIPIYFAFLNPNPPLWPLLIDIQTKKCLFDGQGRLVCIPKNPVRVISLGPSTTEILFNISFKKSKIVAITDYCDYPPDNITGIPQIVNGYWSPSPPDIIAFLPDLVIGRNTPGQLAIIPNLEALNIPFFIMPDEETITDILNNIELIGNLVNNRDVASQVVTKLENALEKITNDINGTGNSTLLPIHAKTYYEIWNDPIFFAGGSTFIDDLIYKAGGINLGGFFAGSWPSLDAPGTELADLDPEHITIPDWYSWSWITGRTGWAFVTAVIDNNYTQINQDIIERPGPRIIDALYILAKDLCPNIFTWY